MIHHTDRIYGQSWTNMKSSDAMWRIYSRMPADVNNAELDKVAVRIQTTIGNLLDILYVDDICMSDTRIGRVDYLDSNQLINWLGLHSNLKVSDLADTFFDSLMIKRDAFAHEQEVRALKILDSETPHPDCLKFDIDPMTFIDELVYEPRIKPIIG